MSTQYTDLQLDALRELANIGSGNASTALSSMLGRSVDITVPAARVLPMADAVPAGGNPAENKRKFADHAVPELVRQVVARGGRRLRLEAALVGGASMFVTSSTTLEVGQRNEAAVREQLKALRIPVIAAETGGKRGRTVRVYVPSTTVTVREAGGSDHELVAPRAGMAA